MITQGHERPTQVLVVGAGPVGLFAGLCAARRGLAVEIIDENPRREANGHATVLHASSIRLLESLGLAEEVLASGRRLDRIGLYVDGVRSATLNLATPALAVAQSGLEDLLRTALRAEGIEPSYCRQATTIAESNERVHVRVMRWECVASHADEQEAIWQPVSSSVLETEFAIGADGRNSRVRAALGIDSVVIGRPASYAMFELPSNDLGAEMIVEFSDGLASAMIPLPGGRVRWGFQIESPAGRKLYAADLCELLARRAPWYHGGADRADWGAVVRFEQRLAYRFGKSRTWLAGDAAHGTGPFGAQSMNVGLTEAHHLVRRIAECIETGESVEALEQYGSESRREWQKLLGVNVGFDLFSHAPDWLRTRARRIVSVLPASGFDIVSMLGELGLAVH